FQHNRNLTITAATETSFPPLFVIPTTFRHSHHFSSFPQGQKTKIRNLKSRHSRADDMLPVNTK
ncbi:TPA: hypothetical protein ACLBFM_002078, partial [Neisseria meningitidis]